MARFTSDKVIAFSVVSTRDKDMPKFDLLDTNSNQPPVLIPWNMTFAKVRAALHISDVNSEVKINYEEELTQAEGKDLNSSTSTLYGSDTVTSRFESVKSYLIFTPSRIILNFLLLSFMISILEKRCIFLILRPNFLISGRDNCILLDRGGTTRMSFMIMTSAPIYLNLTQKIFLIKFPLIMEAETSLRDLYSNIPINPYYAPLKVYTV